MGITLAKWLWIYGGDKFLKPKAHKNFHRRKPTTYYYSRAAQVGRLSTAFALTNLVKGAVALSSFLGKGASGAWWFLVGEVIQAFSGKFCF